MGERREHVEDTPPIADGRVVGGSEAECGNDDRQRGLGDLGDVATHPLGAVGVLDDRRGVQDESRRHHRW
jgi:hypothetical protein